MAVLEGDFVHAHRVEAFQVPCLGWTASEGVTETAGEVADLADVYADIRVEGTGCDGEWVPLGVGYFRDLDEQPLSGFVFHAGFAELDFHCICTWLGFVRMEVFGHLYIPYG